MTFFGVILCIILGHNAHIIFLQGVAYHQKGTPPTRKPDGEERHKVTYALRYFVAF